MNQEETDDVVADENSQDSRGDAYRKQRSVILRVERVDDRARVTTDEERVLREGCREIKP